MNNCITKMKYNHISDFERGQIKAYLEEGLSQSEIAKKLGRNRSTISREIKRGCVNVIVIKNGYQKDVTEYSPVASKERYTNNRKLSTHRNRIETNRVSKTFITGLIEEVKRTHRIHSIDTYRHEYKANNPEEYVPSTATLYRYIHQDLIGLKPIDLPMMVRRKPRKKKKETHPHKKKLGNSIELRPESINERKENGHFEIDLVHGVMGKNEKVVMTLVDRRTRFGFVRLLPNSKALTINKAIEAIMREYGRGIIKSITADNGSEFSRLTDLENKNRKIYFAHPYASYERGTNEHFNGLLREFMPKKRSFNKYSKKYVQEIERTINLRPRKILGYKTPNEMFFETAS